ncbi:MAG: molybdenum cofactor biosynthesis protein MoaE [Longimicrobiales bacterium]
MSLHARITREPIDPLRLLTRVETPGVGAAILFVGLVRDVNEGRPVSGLHYEAYAPMAEKVLREIVDEAACRGSVVRAEPHLAVEHRVGELAVGEAAVVVAVSSRHREEAFDACRHVIEEIKRRLPIWKEERYMDGSADWLGGSRPTVQAEHD